LPGGRKRAPAYRRITLLDETYNASLKAVGGPALHLLAGQRGRPLCVLGTMRQKLGGHSLACYQEIEALAAELGLDGLVIVDMGTTARPMERGAPTFPGGSGGHAPEQALRPAAAWLSPGDQLLLKASRGRAWSVP